MEYDFGTKRWEIHGRADSVDLNYLFGSEETDFDKSWSVACLNLGEVAAYLSWTISEERQGANLFSRRLAFAFVLFSRLGRP